MTVQCLALFCPLGERRDDLSQREKRLVNVYGFFRSQACVARLAGSLTAGQVYELKLGHDDVVDCRVVDDLHRQRENGVTSARLSVQVVRRHDLVLHPLIVHLNGVVCVVAAENEEVFDCELFRFGPTNFEPSLQRLIVFVFQSVGVEQVVDFLVVNLQERGVDVDGFGALGSLSLRENLPDRPHSKANFPDVVHLDLAGPLVTFALLVLVTLHRVRLPRPCLPIREHRRVETLDDFRDEAFDLQLVEDILLAELRVDDFVEFEILDA